MAEVLSSRTREHAGLPTVLTTHLPRNVVFYRRAGFDVLSERTLEPPRGTRYAVWSMALRGA